MTWRFKILVVIAATSIWSSSSKAEDQKANVIGLRCVEGRNLTEVTIDTVRRVARLRTSSIDLTAQFEDGKLGAVYPDKCPNCAAAGVNPKMQFQQYVRISDKEISFGGRGRAYNMSFSINRLTGVMRLGDDDATLVCTKASPI